ncbi:MAG: hypothetical protein GC160_05915 [Acidobacteria bacterium]|nr:hypothetical protein [Acidobacteriota bacterium]
MSVYLLDVNVLLALAWPSHVHCERAQRWFQEFGSQGFATCPLTELAFVRISSNPSFTKDAVTPHVAGELLLQVKSLPGHHFWPDSLDWSAASNSVSALAGHRQVTDAYLLALAIQNRGVLATLDRGALALREPSSPDIRLL